jgi:hypothetical protein
MKTVAEVIGVSRSYLVERLQECPQKRIGVALLVIAMSVGFAQAKRTKHLHKRHATRTEHAQKNAIPLENAIPLCAERQRATATCACGTDASGRPFMCQIGQWCRTFAHACTQ